MARLSDDQRGLVEANLGVAYAAALKYGRRWRLQGADIDLACSAALEALCKAAAKFNPARGVRFTTYATITCERAIRAEIEACRVVRIPQSFIKADMTTHHLYSHARRAQQVISGGETCRRMEELCEDATDPRAAVDDDDAREWMRGALASLGHRERVVLQLRAEGLSFREIGARLGVEHKTAWHLYQQAVGRLRSPAPQRPQPYRRRRQ